MVKSKKTPIIPAILVSCLALMLVAPFSVWKARAEQPHAFNISRAAGVYFTARGQEYYRTHLNEMLANRGVDLTQNSLDHWEYTSPTAVSMSTLPVRFGPFAGTLRSLRDTLMRWLDGFTLRDPRFAVTADGLRYEARGLNLGLAADLARTEALGGDDQGIVVDLSVDIPEFRADADKIRGNDLNNAFLGAFGLNRAWLQLSGRGPFHVEVPVRLKAGPNGSIDFQTLDVSTNAPDVRFTAGFDRPLIMPRVQIQVNDRTMTLSTTQVERELISKEPDLIRIFQHHLRDFIVDELPKRLNTMAYDKLKDGFVMVEPMDAPGAPTGSTDPGYTRGLRLSGLNFRDGGLLHLSLDGYVVDPNRSVDSQPARMAPSGDPALNKLDPSDYDFALVASNGLINEALRLSFLRGYFNSVPEGDGTSFKMISEPVFLAGAPGSRQGRLHISAEMSTEGVGEWVALEDPFHATFDIDVELRPSAAGRGFDMVMLQVDPSSAHVPDEYLTWLHLRDSVDRGTIKKVNKINNGLPAGGKILATNIRVPPDLFGIPIHLKDVEVDPTGQLVLYMEYGVSLP